MALSCNVIRDINGKVKSVLSPSGVESGLYKAALESTGNEDSALALWGAAYTPGFAAYYGNWQSPASGREYSLDSNGEPLLEDVMAYTARESCPTGRLTREEVRGALGFRVSTGMQGMEELAGRIESSLVEGGKISLTRANLKASGLYTGVEIERLMSDGDARIGAEKALQKLRRHMALDYGDKPEVDAYFFPQQSGGISIPTARYDSYGKQVHLSHGDVMDSLSKAHAKFGPSMVYQAVLSTGNEDLISAYENDPDAKEAIEGAYASLTRVPVHRIEGGVESPVDPVERNLRNFAVRGRAASPRMQELLSRAAEGRGTREDMEDIERLAADMGIDVAGLSALHAVDPAAAREVAISLDMAVASLERGDESLIGQLASTVGRYLGTEAVSEALQVDAKGRAVVRLDAAVGPREAFSRHGLLEVYPGLYIRTRMDVSTDEAYSSLAEASSNMPSVMPQEAYPGRYFKKGHLDTAALSKAGSTSEIAESFRRYVLGLTDHYNSEQMILARAALGFPLKPVYTRSETRQEGYDRFRASVGKPVPAGVEADIYRQRLKSKVEGGRLWDNFFKFVSFNSDGSMTINNATPEDYARMDTVLEGALRDKVEAYALASGDPSFSGLFLEEASHPWDVTVDFEYQYYRRNPRLLDEMKKEYDVLGNGDIHVRGQYDDLIRIEDRVLVKVGESAEGSIYSSPSGTAVEIRKAIREHQAPHIQENGGAVRSGAIRDSYEVDTSRVNIEC